jgi:hypothetical protein
LMLASFIFYCARVRNFLVTASQLCCSQALSFIALACVIF